MVRTENGGNETTERLTEQIVTRIADREGVDPLDLPPLNDVIDPDALNALFDTPDSTVDYVKFSYNGYEVTIQGHGQVEATPIEEFSR